MAVLSAKTKSGKEYFAQDMGNGRLRATDKKADANATSLGNYRFLQTGGIMVLTTKSDKELQERREARKLKRQKAVKTIEDRVTKKLLAHPPKKFIEEFAKKYIRRMESEAKKQTKIALASKIKALQEQKKAMK